MWNWHFYFSAAANTKELLIQTKQVKKRVLSLYVCHPLSVSNNEHVGNAEGWNHLEGETSHHRQANKGESTKSNHWVSVSSFFCYCHISKICSLRAQLQSALDTKCTECAECEDNVQHKKSYIRVSRLKRWIEHEESLRTGEEAVHHSTCWAKIRRQCSTVRFPSSTCSSGVLKAVQIWIFPFHLDLCWISCCAPGCHLLSGLVKYLKDGRGLLGAESSQLSSLRGKYNWSRSWWSCLYFHVSHKWNIAARRESLEKHRIMIQSIQTCFILMFIHLFPQSGFFQ